MHADGKVFGHDSGFHSFDDGFFHVLAEIEKSLVIIEPGSVGETSGPGEHGSNGVGRGLVSFLVFSVVSGDGSMGGFGFDDVSGSLQDTGHESQTSVTLGQSVGLDISVVVLASPDESSFGFDDVGHHIIDQTVFVPESFGLEVFLVFGVIEVLENVFESTIVFLHNGVFGGHIQREVSLEGIVEALIGEFSDGGISVVPKSELYMAMPIPAESKLKTS